MRAGHCPRRDGSPAVARFCGILQIVDTHPVTAEAWTGGPGIDPVAQPLSAALHVWRIDLDRVPGPAGDADLPEVERTRAARFLHEADRRRYVASRRALRAVLGRVLQRDPATLRFVIDSFGKPQLCDAASLEFNLSHSAGDCLVAVGEGHPVGVDIEVLKPVPDAAALARRHFTAAEQAELARLAGDERRRAFLVCWTRKEACLKALGVGLSAAPASFEVGCSPDARPIGFALPGGSCTVGLASLALGGHCVGAVARVNRAHAALAREHFAPAGSVRQPG